MGIFSKLSEFLSTNLGDLIGRAREPEVEAQRVLRKLDDRIEEVEALLAEAIVQEKSVQGDLEESRQEARRLEEKAERALAEGDEGAARSHLLARREFQRNIDVLGPEWEVARVRTSELRERLRELRMRRQEVLAAGEGSTAIEEDGERRQDVPWEACIDDELKELEALDEVEGELARLRKKLEEE